MSARLNAAIFSQEFEESREFVTVQPCQIFLPQDHGGGLQTQLHRHIAQETRFHILQTGFQSLVRLPTQLRLCMIMPYATATAT